MFVVEYTFGLGWYTYKESTSMYEAKQFRSVIKKHIGKEGKTRIRRV